MRLVKPNARIVEQEAGIDGIYKQVEYASRLCYASQPQEGRSARDFVEGVIMKSNHSAMLEHGSVYLDIEVFPHMVFDKEEKKKQETASAAAEFYIGNPYSRVEFLYEDYDNKMHLHYYVSTNLRVLFQNDRMEDLKYAVDEPTKYHHKRVAIEFYTDRLIGEEAHRHRKHSPSEQSSRYVNFSKDKHGRELNISWNEQVGDAAAEILEREGDNMGLYFAELCSAIGRGDTSETFDAVNTWLFANLACEWAYMSLTEDYGWKAEEARRILPCDFSTKFVHTAFIEDWEYFFGLRVYGDLGRPHPDMKYVAEKALAAMVESGYLTERPQYGNQNA